MRRSIQRMAHELGIPVTIRRVEGEVLTPAALHLMPLGLVPVLLAAWCGDVIWSLGLPWGACLSWWCQDAPWALWVEVVNALGQTRRY